MATAMLFGAVHALMPGHGKIVLVSYHLGKPSKGLAAFTNGAILALTHVGLAVASHAIYRDLPLALIRTTSDLSMSHFCTSSVSC